MILYICVHLASVAYHLHIFACLCSAAFVLSACVCVCISPWVTYICMYIYRHAYILLIWTSKVASHRFVSCVD